MAKIDINTVQKLSWWSASTTPIKATAVVLQRTAVVAVNSMSELEAQAEASLKAITMNAQAWCFDTAKEKAEAYTEACGCYISVASVMGEIPESMKQLVATYDKAAEALYNAKKANP